MFCPVIEVRSRSEKCTTADARVIGGDAQRDRRTRVGSEQPHLRRLAFRDEVIDGCAGVFYPALHREVPFAVAASAEGKRHSAPAEFVTDAVDQFGEGTRRVTCILWSDWKAMAEQRGRPRSPSRRTLVEIPLQRERAGNEGAVHAVARRYPRLRASASVSGAKQIPELVATMSSTMDSSVQESTSYTSCVRLSPRNCVCSKRPGRFTPQI